MTLSCNIAIAIDNNMPSSLTLFTLRQYSHYHIITNTHNRLSLLVITCVRIPLVLEFIIFGIVKHIFSGSAWCPNDHSRFYHDWTPQTTHDLTTNGYTKHTHKRLYAAIQRLRVANHDVPTTIHDFTVIGFTKPPTTVQDPTVIGFPTKNK